MADLKLQAIISVANKASGPLREINSDLNKLRSPIRGLVKQVKGLDRASGFKELRKGVSGLVKEVAKLGLIGGGAAAAGFVALNKMSQAGDEILKTATAVGISTDALQEWRFVAERSGVSTAAMDKSMQAFTKRLAEARNGTGELYGLLSKKNPEFLKQVLAVDNNTDAFNMMIEAMSKLPDQQRQILLGDKAFSESGRELVKITAMSAEELSKLKKEGRDLGAVLGNESLKKSEAFQDSLTNFTKVAGSLAFMFATELMPSVRGIMEQTQAWMQSLDKESIKVFAKSTAESIKDLAGWVKEATPQIMDFVKSIGGFKTVAIALGLVLAGPLLSAVVTLGAALLATPFGLLATIAIASVGMITGAFNPLATFFPKLWDGIVDSVGKSIFKLVEMTKKVAGFITGFFGGDDGEANNTKQLIKTTSQQSPKSNVLPFSNNQRGYKYKPFKKPNLLSSQSAPKPQEIVSKVGGRIVVEVRGNAKVASVESNNPLVPLDVDSGRSLMAL